jgi:predicted nucleotidyltransferase component of viral defense system
MLSLEEIKRYFPDNCADKTKDMLREYLQCQILKSIFNSKHAYRLVFIGGTALRLIYNTKRFSEDLDFDNKGLQLNEWNEIAEKIQKDLSLMNFDIEIKNTRVNETVFHHNIYFPSLMFNYNLSAHQNQKLLIKVDSQDQLIKYESIVMPLSKFDVFTQIKTLSLDIALSQKFRAFFDREMGRDLFDISSIAPQTKPNYNYLKQALNIDNPLELKKEVLKRCSELDFEQLSKRAKPFLFHEDGVKSILYFKDYMESYEF